MCTILKWWVASGTAVMTFTLGVHTYEVVATESGEVRVGRASGDGFGALATSQVSLAPSEALASCAPWDVKETCCAAGCAAKKGTNWPKADDVLRGCMRGLGCSEDQVKGATVFMKCDCPK